MLETTVKKRWLRWFGHVQCKEDSGNYSQEKVATLVWSCAMQGRLQKSITGNALDS